MAGLTSDRMRRLIEEAKEAFDWVIIDTPPLMLLPDAHLLSSLVDGAVLVVKAEFDAARDGQANRGHHRPRRGFWASSSTSATTRRTAGYGGYVYDSYYELARRRSRSTIS